MKARPADLLPAVAALLTVVGPRVAGAVERECPAMAVESDARFRARFPELLGRIQTELSTRADIDTCAEVALRFDNDADINVSVTLPDGRRASRSVARRDDVIPTLQALLLVPASARVTVAASTPAIETAPVTGAALSPRPLVAKPQPPRLPPAASPERLERDQPVAVAEVRQFGFELSVISGVRLGDGQFGYGVGMLSFLEVHRWLVGFEGRADGYRSTDGGDPDTALELAILGGRRFNFSGVALDLSAGPGVAMKGVTLSVSETVPAPMTRSVEPPPLRTEPSSGPVPRLLVGARLGLSPRSVFRTFVGIDGELGPTRTSPDPEAVVSSPRMPLFTLGLALGVTVGTP